MGYSVEVGKAAGDKTREQLLAEFVTMVERGVALVSHPDAFAWNARKCAETLLALRVLELGKSLPKNATCESLMQAADLSRNERTLFTSLQQYGNTGTHLQLHPDQLPEPVRVVTEELRKALFIVVPEPPRAALIALQTLRTHDSVRPGQSLDPVEVERALHSSRRAAKAVQDLPKETALVEGVQNSLRRAARSPALTAAAGFLVGVVIAVTIGGVGVAGRSPFGAQGAVVTAKPPTPPSPVSVVPLSSASASAPSTPSPPATNMRVVAAGKGFCVDTPPFTARAIDSADRQEILSGSVLLRLYACSHDKWQEHADSHKQFHKDSTSFSIRGMEAGRMFVERCRVGMPGPHVCMRVLFKAGDEARAEPLLLAPSACP